MFCLITLWPQRLNGPFQLEADVVLVAVGRRPYTEGLNLEAAGVELDNRGRVVIDDQFNTSVKGIKCIGDVTFGPMLAHKAEEEGPKPPTLLHPLQRTDQLPP